MSIRTTPPFSALAALALASLPALAFDWKPLSNETLRRDAMALAKATASAFPNEQLGAEAAALAAKDAAATNDFAWISATLSFGQHMLDAYPPSEKNAEARKAVFLLLDYPLHTDNLDPSAPRACAESFARATRSAFDSAKTRVLTELSSSVVTNGALLWKVYNMGFVIKTRSHAFAIDLASGPFLTFLPPPKLAGDPKSPENQRLIKAYVSECEKLPPVWTDAEVGRLTDMIDALFITHPHGDHYNLAIVSAMLRKKKPVVAPFAWTAQAMRSRQKEAVDEMRPLVEQSFKVVRDTKNEALVVGGLKVAVFPGNQGERIPNSVYLFESDGIRIAHNGDNCARPAESALKRFPAADIVLANCWSGLPAFLETAAPAAGAADVRQVAIAGHENELGHGVSHRESWKELYTRDDRLGRYRGAVPVFTLGWGERLAYPPAR